MTDESMVKQPSSAEVMAECQELIATAQAGGLATLSRTRLERATMLLCHPNMMMASSQYQLQQIGEAVRLLLLAKMSQESEARSSAIADKAVWVAKVTLVFVIVQLIIAVPPTIDIVRGWMYEPAKEQQPAR